MIIKDAEKRIRLNDKEYHCALDITMDFIGGKWKSVIIWYLCQEPKRFSALKKVIPDITEKMLSLQLKALEQSGLVERTVLAEKPLIVQYSLTTLGRSAIPAVEALAAWGRQMGNDQGTLVDVVR
jgi:DNA-binding HxlR family transcriptional regulator